MPGLVLSSCASLTVLMAGSHPPKGRQERQQQGQVEQCQGSPVKLWDAKGRTLVRQEEAQHRAMLRVLALALQWYVSCWARMKTAVVIPYGKQMQLSKYASVRIVTLDITGDTKHLVLYRITYCKTRYIHPFGPYHCIHSDSS